MNAASHVANGASYGIRKVASGVGNAAMISGSTVSGLADKAGDKMINSYHKNMQKINKGVKN